MAYGKANVDTVQSSTAGVAPIFKDGNGTETGTLCRAWVNFDGTGTVAIRGSFNVSSITDNGTGTYTVNFTTNMSDVNYAANVTGGGGFTGSLSGTRAVGSVQVISFYSGSYYDNATMCVSVFR